MMGSGLECEGGNRQMSETRKLEEKLCCARDLQPKLSKAADGRQGAVCIRVSKLDFNVVIGLEEAAVGSITSAIILRNL